MRVMRGLGGGGGRGGGGGGVVWLYGSVGLHEKSTPPWGTMASVEGNCGW